MRLNAGFSKVTITPPPEIGSMQGVERVTEDIYARVAVIGDSKETLVVILLDVLGIDRTQDAPIRAQICELLNIPPQNILMTCTHNHSGVALSVWTLQPPDPLKEKYLDFLKDQLLTAVKQAKENQTSLHWSWSSGQVTDLARSRRLKKTDGKVITLQLGNPESWPLMEDPTVTSGPVDEEVIVLVARDDKGNVAGILANYACHNTITLKERAVCPDVFGVAMTELEQLFPDTITLIMNGAAGDIDATKTSPHLGPRDYSEAQKAGKSLAGHLKDLLPSSQPLKGQGTNAEWREAYFPVNEVFLQKAGGVLDFVYPGLVHSQGPVRNFESVVQTGLLPGRIQRMSLGDFDMIALPGEAFCEIGMRIKVMRSPKPTAVIGLANDCLGYIPTPQALEEGGYDATPSEWMRMTAAAEKVIIDTVKQLIDPCPLGHDHT